MSLLEPLSNRSIIDLIAPGSDASVKQIKQAIKTVKALGFVPRVKLARCLSKNIKGDLPPKFEIFKEVFNAKDSKVVWCIRGGYGCQKLMPYVLKMRIPSRMKLLIGYSDITALQLCLVQKWAWPVLHFPVLADMPSLSSLATRQLKQVLLGKTDKYGRGHLHFSNLKILNSIHIKQKLIKSKILGGNMTLIQSSIGTSWAGRFKDKILFLEDVHESAYRVDRALWQMQNANVLQGIQALVLGDFMPASKEEAHQLVQIFKTFSKSVAFPVVMGMPSGHGKHKSPLPMGTVSKLHLDRSKQRADLFVESPFRCS